MLKRHCIMYNAQRIILAIGCIASFTYVRHIWEGHISRGPPLLTALKVSLPKYEGMSFPNDSTYPEHVKIALQNEVPVSIADDRVAARPPQTPFKDQDGIEDVVLVLKTGSTEMYEKLPIHFTTTFACAPDFLIYSDLPQNFGKHPVQDALASMSKPLRNEHPDLEQYRKLKAYAAAGGDAADLKGEQRWGLDKWRFMPMISNAYHVHGDDKKWYVFMEADTYISVHNLLLWLRRLDPREKIYAGAQVVIGETEFAHGGSGFLLSAAAVKTLTYVQWREKTKWEKRTAEDCCGDKIIAEALLETPGIRLLRSFPLMQGETPASLDWSPAHWCRPAISWHHVQPSEIDKLWQFEQSWRDQRGAHEPILYADYFQHFVAERIAGPGNSTIREGWDNMSIDWVFPRISSAKACADWCEWQVECLQWTWTVNFCRGSKVPRLGRPQGTGPEITNPQMKADTKQAGFNDVLADGDRQVSGWLLHRIKAYRTGLEPCAGTEQWVTKNHE